MKILRQYIRPDVEIILPKESFMLDYLPVSNTFVGEGDEAANDAFFAEEDIDDDYDPFFDE